jgi:hypothetical protein
LELLMYSTATKFCMTRYLKNSRLLLRAQCKNMAVARSLRPVLWKVCRSLKAWIHWENADSSLGQLQTIIKDCIFSCWIKPRETWITIPGLTVDPWTSWFEVGILHSTVPCMWNLHWVTAPKCRQCSPHPHRTVTSKHSSH